MPAGVIIAVLIAEVMIPIAPIVGPMVAEKEVAETLRVGIAGGDLGVVFHRTGGDRLALVVFRAEVRGNLGGTRLGILHLLDDLEGIAAELLDAQLGAEAGIHFDPLAFFPILVRVVLRLDLGQLIRKLEADGVGADRVRCQLVGDVEGPVRGDRHGLAEDFLFRGVQQDDAGGSGRFRGDFIATQRAQDALEPNRLTGAVKRAVGEKERLAG